MIGKYRLSKTLYFLGNECVGLNKNYMAEGKNFVTILQKNRKGDLKYPGLYTINSSLIQQYPCKSFKTSPLQYFVPIEALQKVSSTTYTTDYGYN